MSTQHISTTRLTIPGTMKNITLILLLTSIFIIKPAHGLGAISDRDDFHQEFVRIDKTNSPNPDFTPEHLNENVVDIPDTAFLYALIDEGVDINGDGLISYGEAENVNYLSCIEKEITDLTGIEAFVNLDTFDCSWNPVNNLDVSNNTALKYLSCRGNNLTSLDVSNNTALTNLICFSNQLTSLDVSRNTALTELMCEGNQLASLNVTGCTNLKNLICGLAGYGWDETNQLTSLDLSTNTNLTSVKLSSMPSLGEVCIWEGFDEGIAQTAESPNVYFTTECFYNTIVFIPDTAFLYALIDEGVDTNGDSLISYEEAESVSTLDVSFKRPKDMTGIEAFINLDSLSCDPQELNKLVLSNNPNLKYLHCDGTLYWGYYSPLEILDVSNNPLLKVLDCSMNPYLSSLDLSNLDSLQILNCSFCNLNKLDISNCDSLKYLYCNSNPLTILDVSNQIALIELNCSDNQLISLNLSNNNSLVEINLESMATLQEVCIWETPFPPEDVEIYTWRSPNVFFTTNCQLNNVIIPDTAFLYALIEVGVDTNGDSLISYAEAEEVRTLKLPYSYFWGECLASSNVIDFTGIEAFIFLDTFICACNNAESLDLSSNIYLKYLECSHNQLKKLKISSCTELSDLYCVSNQLKGLDVSGNTVLTNLDCGSNQLTDMDISNNTELTSLDCSYNELIALDISNNTKLTFLDCSHNELIALDILYNINLTELRCDDNELPSLDVTHHDALTRLNCSFNKMTSIDVTNNTALIDFLCSGNPMANIDVTNNINLEGLWCYEVDITSLDVSKNPGLTFIGCMDNQLTNLDISNNTLLRQLSCWGNSITTLDVSKNTVLEILQCGNNELTILDVSKNTLLSALWIENMPSLIEVCVWEMPFPPLGFDLGIDGSRNVHFTTECTIGIEDQPVQNISIYPNPTNTHLTIETDFSKAYFIEITSLNGQLLLCKEMEGTIHHLDLSPFQNGIYFITIRSKDFVTTRKIIKM